MGSRVDNGSHVMPPAAADVSVTEMTLSQKPPLLSDMAEFLFRIICYVILSAVIGIFGIVANIINIIVFIRQGIFSDGSSLNLFFLALADLGCVVTNVLHSVGMSFIMADIPDLPFDIFDVLYLAVGWPYTNFMLANRVMTAYVAFERCMCVMMPFRVKSMFTPRRTLIYILILLAYTFFSHIPLYLTYRLVFQNQEGTNTSKLVIAFTSENEVIFDVTYYVNYLGVSIVAVVIVLVCTVVTGSHINTSKEWRKGVSNSISMEKPHVDQTKRTATATDIGSNQTETNPDKAARFKNPTVDKETRLVKMITSISIIFLICYILELIVISMKTVDGRVYTQGQYYRLAHLMYSIMFVTATINSSINIIVYYNMSTRYRKEFRLWCGKSD